ncbi:hypothetical protein Misp01_58040 [Microtetraspora sp. NBRC 13810]|uniref:hypothetical protein n=1 Tax=Microtetraspora sp. NBRC 13810 TaxID=3030990 RepID=UPI0024A534CD|nr:hypothetical protein [Microtetraspora sp. NBRC 13810]GLW10676.1 hypothetical protein Misp01_58040 [Microtetraspora sp. NBRC 13810]
MIGECFPPEEASRWRRVRRYAVPGWMIEQAAERRLAGDWRGACAVAGVDVAVDLAEVAATHGRTVAGSLEEDLAHLVPDLLRWHLPRTLGGQATISTGRAVVLARYGWRGGGPCLYVVTPRRTEGPQRITLRFADAEPLSEGRWKAEPAIIWLTARHLWDVRHVSELLRRCGGGHRTPFFHTDGTPLTPAELPTRDPAHDSARYPGRDDLAARAEWVAMLHERGEVEEALAAVGIEVEPVDFSMANSMRFLRESPLALARLVPELRAFTEAVRADRVHVPLSWSAVMEFGPGASLRGRIVRLRRDTEGITRLPEACRRRLPDLDLLREAKLTPGDLHPLVRTALFPTHADSAHADSAHADHARADHARADHARAGVGWPGPAEAWPAVRVRCRGEWHEVAVRDGVLRMPHSDEEQRREQAMAAFGGPVSGCFAVRRAWTGGGEWLPKGLRAQRKEPFAHAQHGDTPGLLRLLDAGFDPRVRDGQRRTLMHVLPLLPPLDHEILLPRLLAAGLDVDARDAEGRTPLHEAVCNGGSPALVRALLAAGARPALLTSGEESLRDFLIDRWKRHDLLFLLEESPK